MLRAWFEEGLTAAPWRLRSQRPLVRAPSAARRALWSCSHHNCLPCCCAGKRKSGGSDQSGKENRKKAKQVDAPPPSPGDVAVSNDQAAPAKARLGRKAAEDVAYAPSAAPRATKGERVKAEALATVDTEEAAWAQTASASGPQKQRRCEE